MSSSVYASLHHPPVPVVWERVTWQHNTRFHLLGYVLAHMVELRSKPASHQTLQHNGHQHTAEAAHWTHNTLDSNGSPHNTTPPHCTLLSQHAAITILCPDKVSLSKIS